MNNKKTTKEIGTRDHVDLQLKELVTHGSEQFPIEIQDWAAEPYKEYGMHWHDEMEIVNIKAGAMYYIIDDHEVHAHAGDFILVPPRAKHCLWSDESTGELLKLTNLIFDIKMLNSATFDICDRVLIKPLLDGNISFPYLIDKSCDRYQSFKSAFRDIQRCYKEDDAFSLVKIKSKLFDLLYEILKLQVEDKKPKNRSNIVLAKTFEYIQLNYHHSDISAKTLASMFSYSEPYFMKLFKDNFGVTFVKYVNDLRLKKAMDLLIGTDMPIDEITVKVGFSSESYFIKLFKTKYGHTPGKFRAQAIINESIGD